jgi:hypothetical protein
MTVAQQAHPKAPLPSSCALWYFRLALLRSLQRMILLPLLVGLVCSNRLLEVVACLFEI